MGILNLFNKDHCNGLGIITLYLCKDLYEVSSVSAFELYV